MRNSASRWEKAVASTGTRLICPPQAKSVEGQEIRNLYDIVFIFAVVIFAVVEGLIIWSVIRYRRKPGDDELPPQTHGNNLAEITWTLIPSPPCETVLSVIRPA